jgi:tetratricopeptide (TPR) repeat protein
MGMKFFYIRCIAIACIAWAPFGWAGQKKPAAAQAAQAAKAPETAVDFQNAGDLAMKKGKVEDAMALYRQCLEKAGEDPAFDKVALAVGRHCHKKGEFKDVRTYLLKIKGKISTQLSYKIMLSRALQETGSPDSAIALIEGLAKNRRVAVKSRLRMYKILGAAYKAKKEMVASAAWYNRYIQSGGRRTPDIVYLIASSYESRKPATAIAIYRKNIKRFPKDYRNYLHLAKMYASSPATSKQATGLVKKASMLASSDNNAETWLTLGRVNAELGRNNAALAAYKKSLELNDKNLEAKIRVGMMLVQKGQAGEAITFLENAHEQAPDSTGPIRALVSVYQRTGKPDKAVGMLIKLKKVQPKNVEVRGQLAQAYMSAGKDQKALEEIQGALEIERDYGLLVPYAKLLVKVGKAQEAIAPLEEILGMMPDNIEALMVYADAKTKLKKYDEAVNIYKEIMSYDPENALVMCRRADVHLLQEKVKWAEMYFKRALKADPRMPFAEIGLAKVAKLYNRTSEFNERLERARSIAPNDPAVRKAIEEARSLSK